MSGFHRPGRHCLDRGGGTEATAIRHTVETRFAINCSRLEPCSTNHVPRNSASPNDATAPHNYSVAHIFFVPLFFVYALRGVFVRQVRDTTLLVDVMFAQLSVLSAAKIREAEDGGDGAFIDLPEKTKAGDVITVRIERVEKSRRRGTDREKRIPRFCC